LIVTALDELKEEGGAGVRVGDCDTLVGAGLDDAAGVLIEVGILGARCWAGLEFDEKLAVARPVHDLTPRVHLYRYIHSGLESREDGQITSVDGATSRVPSRLEGCSKGKREKREE